MAGKDTQDLILRAKAEGFDQTAKKIGELTKAEAKLEKQTERIGKASKKAAGQVRELAEAQERLGEQTDLAGASSKRSEHGWRKTTSVIGLVAGALLKLVNILRTAVLLLKALAAVGAVLKAMGAVTQAIRDDVKERLRLIEVMKIQGKVADALQRRTLDQKDAIERIAAGRRQGGFKTPDAARAAQVGARRAQEQFTTLSDADVNQVFGMFGDLGFSQDELTNLAFINRAGKLNVDPDLPDAVLKRLGRRRLRRFQGQVDTSARVETLQGQGTGRGEFRDGQPTERAQRILGELRSPAGSQQELIARMKEVLPPETDFERLAELAKIFGTSGELEASVQGLISRNPLAPINDFFAGNIGIEVPGQGGLLRQGAEKFLSLGEVQTVRIEFFQTLLQFMKRIEKEGGVLPIQKARDESTEALEKAARSMEAATTALREQADQPRTVHVHNNNVKNTYPDRRAQQAQIRNGQNDLQRRAGY